MKFPKQLKATDWNELQARANAGILAQGKNIRITQTENGQIVSDIGASGFKHPWFTEVEWDSEYGADTDQKGIWTASITPGFINGDDPMYLVPESETELDGLKRSNGQVSTGRAVDGYKQLPLCAGPKIRLHRFKKPAGKIPPYLIELGAYDPVSQLNTVETNNGISLILNNQQEDDPAKKRAVMKCDIWLSVARPSLQMNADIQGNLLLGQIVDYSATYNFNTVSQYGTRGRILTGPESPTAKARPKTGLLGFAIGGDVTQDDSQDHLQICTVWMLSPEGGAAEAIPKQPESDWFPVVQHKLFWNLRHATNTPPPFNYTQSPAVNAGLAAFVGRYTIAPMATIGAMNAEADRIFTSVFNSKTNEGVFWSI